MPAARLLKKSASPVRFFSFVAQGFNRIKARCLDGRQHAADESHHNQNPRGNQQVYGRDSQMDVVRHRRSSPSRCKPGIDPMIHEIT